MMKVVIILCLLFNVIAVNATDVTPVGIHPVCQKVKFMSTDARFYDRVYDKNYKNIASQAFVYALMASNVYEKYDSSNPQFNIPNWEQVGDKRANWKGFGAHVYKSIEGPQKIAIAFEGTDPSSIADWIFGNLNIYWLGQYGDAQQLIDEVALAYPDAEIITTGHSLGGGLAIHAALHHSNVKAFAFNSSPRIFMPNSFTDNGSEIILISENEDVLGELRARWGTLDKIKILGPFDKFDFLSLATNNNDKIVEHGMYAIARGIMLVAASGENKDAISILLQLGELEKSCPGAE